ncbi:hypothetical protein XAUC_03160 [Xanthomonas citri pv. aurantifolii str. ICPB 10535]|nr:hypothetical protein XAUC_03160 [Xanthomonas citri pv. aurantifolii str. ICPB 10535]
MIVVDIVVGHGDMVHALLHVDAAIEGGIARTGTLGERGEDGVVVDPDLGRLAAGVAFQRNRIGIFTALQQTDGHVLDDHVVRIAHHPHAEVRRRAIGALDRDIALVLDLHCLGRQLPLRAHVLDGAEVELAGVVEHQPTATGIVVDGGLHRFERRHVDRCLVAAAGGGRAVADRAGDRARGASGQCKRECALERLDDHVASPKEVDKQCRPSAQWRRQQQCDAWGAAFFARFKT